VRGEQVAQTALAQLLKERGLVEPRERLSFTARRHQSRIILVMNERAVTHAQESTVARTIRIPAALRERITTDAERCGRSFEGQVIALLRRHYGEDVDIAPAPAGILALAVASLADIPASQRDLLTRKLEDRQR
jgi:hypothetical protein